MPPTLTRLVDMDTLPPTPPPGLGSLPGGRMGAAASVWNRFYTYTKIRGVTFPAPPFEKGL
jgi:hypothetical protein